MEVVVKDQFLKALRNRRAKVAASIEAEQARPAPDHLKVGMMKKMRLRLRDQIEFIERMNRNGQPSVVPVVRRRSFRPVLQGRS